MKCSKLLKIQNLLKLVLVLLTFYLLWNELNVFLFEKPTYSSKAKVGMEPKDFPSITICANPGFDNQELKRHGYEQSFKYQIGDVEGTNKIGWIGNQTANSTFEFVADKISTIKSVQDCPSTRAFLEDEAGNMKFAFVLFELTKPLHPNGQCCRSVIMDKKPDRFVRLKDLASFKLNALNFRVKLREDKTKANSFSMFLSSREAENDYHMDKFTIEGAELLASSRNLGYYIYDLQIYKHLYLGFILAAKTQLYKTYLSVCGQVDLS